MAERKSLDSTMIQNVLNYWYSFDFLGQNSLQTELSRQEKEALEYALNNEGQRQTHSITCRDPLEEGKTIHEKVGALLAERHMGCTGKITVFLGSISRNFCIEQIVRLLDAEEQREASLSEIALGCLQVGPNGEYIPNSFSLSPVLWSLSKITGIKAGQLPQGWLSKTEYDKENRSFEETLSGVDVSGYDGLREITRSIIGKYISAEGTAPEGSGLSEEINLCYRMYKNESEREKRENEYHGLTMDFYADDLEMILSQIEEFKKKGSVSPKLKDVLFYIQSAFDMQKDLEITRHDLTGETEDINKEKQYSELKEILDIRRAPLGKWPSRHMPFFMQQVAINLAIDEKHEKGTVFENLGSIFSINGSPGTGKTTLIKELIANNIVKRAILLAKFENPDDIFEECDFKNGPDPKTHTYAKYNFHYYRIKPDYQLLTHYAIVVASNNNAAVDNITVEIPDLKSVQDNLQPKEGDSEEMKQGLKEILDLFNPANGKPEFRRVTADYKASEWQQYNDLYFSPYADNLFSNDRKTWGLISVPLGKKSNLNRFYKKILNEMGFGPLNKSKGRGLRPDERKADYKAARDNFMSQLEKVKKLRDDIAAYTKTENDNAVELKEFCTNSKGIDQFTVFSPDYYQALHSSDTEESVKAHMGNPWFTERYNREREKLFCYAMLLNKEFVLASDCCRSNLSLLGMAWHTDVTPKHYYDDTAVYFDKEDLEACMTPLLQSLQLMVPVISTTFASVGSFFRYVKEPGSIGTLIIDEAGQAAPQTAVGALWRAHRAIVIGDPKQIEPVISDDVSLLKTAYGDDVYRCYSEKSLSVQKFADYLNCCGTRMYDSEEDDEGQWIGSPLTVHRRCISPMYEISNRLSYADTMKQITPEPSPEVIATFSGIQTNWLNISGKENGKKDHFVPEQGDRVLRILDDAFKVYFENHPEADPQQLLNDDGENEVDSTSGTNIEEGPDLFIISPFNTVIEGMKQHLENNLTNPSYPTISSHTSQVKDWLTDYRNVHIGTVHKFQGREANEVIFLLGCDLNSAASTNWVKKNIINVAVTRARYRLVIIGDAEAWKGCSPMMEAKRIIDTYALKKIRELTSDPENESRLRQAEDYIGRIPSMEAVSITRVESQYGTFENNRGVEEKAEYIIDNETVLQEYADTGFLFELTDGQLQRFGFESRETFNRMGEKICRNLTMGINLYDMLKVMKPAFENGGFDVSFIAIPFCIAIEQSMQEHYFRGLSKHFPDFEIKAPGLQKLREAEKRKVTLGAFHYVIKEHTAQLGGIMKTSEREDCTEPWWEEYARKLQKCRDERNNCCHSTSFTWSKLEKLLNVLFGNAGDEQTVGGLFCEVDAGRSLYKVPFEGKENT